LIIKLINEKTSLSQKYTKILDIQSKLTQSESMDNSEVHLENIKKLNEKIYDLSDENNYLKSQLELINRNIENDSNIEESVNFNLKKTDKENIFRNNLNKDTKQQKFLINQEDSFLNDKSYLSVANKKGNLKTLEQRVLELEKEIRQRGKSRDTLETMNVVIENRSKSAIKKPSTIAINNVIKPEKIKSTIPKIKAKKKKVNKADKTGNTTNKTNNSLASNAPSSKLNSRLK
jgi:hypothetical protein